MTERLYHILAINWQDIRNPMGGGAEVHFHEIFKRLVAAGHTVTLLCCGFKGAAAEESIDGIRIVRRGSRGLFNYFVPRAYRQLARQHHYDVVIDDLNKIPFYTPLFVKEKLLTIVHHFFGRSIYLETSFLPASYVFLSEKLVPLVYKNVPFACVSDSTRQELRACGIKASIDLLPNGVDVASYKQMPQLRSKSPLIGYLGRLKKYKSVEHVIQAMSIIRQAVPETKLLIIGEGDYRPHLQRRVQEAGLQDAVEFTGMVSHEEKIRRLNQLWLTVNPSQKEGWGLTVIEANACGLPVVAADSPGLRDSVQHNRTGILYRYGDI
ncbi:glycosyltransferase family 4 protein, partial [candidate division KSB1 bacterium]|nr:glycosyltransferase family 4 protein [candidate division KSB1 bacterium]